MNYSLPPLDPHGSGAWGKNESRHAEWLLSVLNYLANEPWASNDDARTWLAHELHPVGIETNCAPLPPPFDLPSPFVNISNGRGIGSKCRQTWWHRGRDHREWVSRQVDWLSDLLQCVGYNMDILDDWQGYLRGMLTVYVSTDCGCNPTPKPVVRPLRSGTSVGLYD